MVRGWFAGSGHITTYVSPLVTAPRPSPQPESESEPEPEPIVTADKSHYISGSGSSHLVRTTKEAPFQSTSFTVGQVVGDRMQRDGAAA